MAASPCDSRNSEWKGCYYNYTGKLDLEVNHFQSSETFAEANGIKPINPEVCDPSSNPFSAILSLASGTCCLKSTRIRD